MIYPTAQAWRDAPNKHVCLFAMSGLGKTYVSNMLRDAGGWFHYSVDYRIGTRYMGEHIADNFKAEAMKNPFLAELLRSDSIYVASNITFENLAPLSTYLGKPGDPARGGLSIEDYQRRQAQHMQAEALATADAVRFIDRAKQLYGYPNFICDCSGSLCEVVDAAQPGDPLMTELSAHMLPIWIKGDAAHTDTLIKRFDRDPKPMCYSPDFLVNAWETYAEGRSEAEIDPDEFVRWTYTKALAHRKPRYAAMAEWGVTVEGKEWESISSEADFVDVIAAAIERRTARS
ncbi:MAG: ATPase [Rhodobacteraceae bacterium]|nr:ATPase [Paracoccaceae bacterium]